MNLKESLFIIGVLVLNILLWFMVLPIVGAIIVVGITGCLLAGLISHFFDRSEKKRATLGDTSDK